VSDPAGEAIVFFDTANPLPQRLGIGLSHSHSNWAFTSEGLYRLTVEVTGTLVGGGTMGTGPADYCFYVGDLAGLPTDPSQSQLSIAGMEPEYEAGQQVVLRAVQTPETCLGGYRWHARCGAATDFTEVGTGTTHAFTADLARDGCQYRVTLHEADGSLVSTSAPVTLRVRSAASPPEPSAPPGAQPAATPPAARPLGALALSLSARRPPRLGTLRRSGKLPVQCRLDAAGTCAVRAWVSARDARRLGLGRRAATLGRGERRLTGPGAATVSVKLNRRALGRAGRRLRVHLTGTGSAPGRPTATRSAALTLRR
jgi:surface-anchored protein